MRRFRDFGQGVLVATAEQLTCSSMAVAAANGGCLIIDPAVSVLIPNHLQRFRHIRIYAENLSFQCELGAFTPKNPAQHHQAHFDTGWSSLSIRQKQSAVRDVLSERRGARPRACSAVSCCRPSATTAWRARQQILLSARSSFGLARRLDRSRPAPAASKGSLPPCPRVSPALPLAP